MQVLRRVYHGNPPEEELASFVDATELDAEGAVTKEAFFQTVHIMRERSKE